MPLHRRATPEVRASSDSLLSFSVVSTASRCTSESGGAAIHERLEIDDQLDLLEIFGTDEAYFEFERALDAAVEKEVSARSEEIADRCGEYASECRRVLQATA